MLARLQILNDETWAFDRYVLAVDLEQGEMVEGDARRPPNGDGWLRSAHACENRSFVRSAGACEPATEMPVRGSLRLVESDTGEPVIEVDVSGTLVVPGRAFENGLLPLSFDDGTATFTIGRDSPTNMEGFEARGAGPRGEDILLEQTVVSLESAMMGGAPPN